LTLIPSNQIIHPGRVYGLFKNWDRKTPFKKGSLPLLYEDLDDASANQIQLLDNEVQHIKMAILLRAPLLDLCGVLPIKERIIKTYTT